MNHNPVVLEMRNLRLVIGIVVILAVVCSPALAINTADFRATDWRQSHSSFPEPKIGHPYDWRSTPLPEMKSKLPTIVVPTPTPEPEPYPIHDEEWVERMTKAYVEGLAKFYEDAAKHGAIRRV